MDRFEKLFESLEPEEIEEAIENKSDLIYEAQCLSEDLGTETSYNVYEVEYNESGLERFLRSIKGSENDNRLLIEREEVTEVEEILGGGGFVQKSYSYGVMPDYKEDEFLDLVDDLGYEIVVPIN